MSETMIAAMRCFAEVAEARSFTLAARRLAMSKQTLSRRIAELERALGVQLLHRTTRRLHTTDVGAVYAARCAEIVRLADEANRAVSDAQLVPRGTLRVTADPVFGDAFITDLVLEYSRRWPEVRVEVALTRRRVDLVEEGFDVAFRIGAVEEPAFVATRLGPARVRYCASPAYVRKRGRPRTPRELTTHSCLPMREQKRWPFRGKKGLELIPIEGRLELDSLAMTRAAALAGFGIAIFPEFACARDLARRRLVSVLDDFSVEVGGVWLVHARALSLTARVRAFVDLAVSRLSAHPPWMKW